MLYFCLNPISGVQRPLKQGTQLQQRVQMDNRQLGQDHRGTRAGIKHPSRKINPPQINPPHTIAHGVFNTDETFLTVSNRLDRIDRLSEPGVKWVADHRLGITHILR